MGTPETLRFVGFLCQRIGRDLWAPSALHESSGVYRQGPSGVCCAGGAGCVRPTRSMQTIPWSGFKISGRKIEIETKMTKLLGNKNTRLRWIAKMIIVDDDCCCWWWLLLLMMIRFPLTNPKEGTTQGCLYKKNLQIIHFRPASFWPNSWAVLFAASTLSFSGKSSFSGQHWSFGGAWDAVCPKPQVPKLLRLRTKITIKWGSVSTCWNTCVDHCWSKFLVSQIGVATGNSCGSKAKHGLHLLCDLLVWGPFKAFKQGPFGRCVRHPEWRIPQQKHVCFVFFRLGRQVDLVAGTRLVSGWLAQLRWKF